jgi:uncharacterized damage-inducible protein DinB
MRTVDALIMELEREAETTRRLLNRLPDDKLAWKPHEKSMTLGQLAIHVATIPGAVASVLSADTYGASIPPASVPAGSRAQIVEAFEKSLADAKAALAAFDDAALARVWGVKRGDQPLMAMPRGAAIRFVLLNHAIHHRGQLSVYLRLLGTPLPPMYGPSADENPWSGQ